MPFGHEGCRRDGAQGIQALCMRTVAATSANATAMPGAARARPAPTFGTVTEPPTKLVVLLPTAAAGGVVLPGAGDGVPPELWPVVVAGAWVPPVVPLEGAVVDPGAAGLPPEDVEAAPGVAVVTTVAVGAGTLVTVTAKALSPGVLVRALLMLEVSEAAALPAVSLDVTADGATADPGGTVMA